MHRFATFEAACEYLFGLRNRGSKYGIKRMELLVEAIGRPQQAFPSIHIAGTNGKGSTCAMLESIYRQAGYRTGLYTSPHLIDLCERIQVNRRQLPHEDLLAYVNQLAPVAAELSRDEPDKHPSFFEFMTAIAFLHFAREQVDVAIIEVGLGGRLDATNVITPIATAITSISLDHCEILGDTLPQIAREKAGIIKHAVPIVIGRLPKEAEVVICGVAAQQESPVYSTDDSSADDIIELPELDFYNTYNRYNAATASTLCQILNHQLPVERDCIIEGLKNFQWEARWDTRKLAQGKHLILDATHNPEGVQELVKSLERLVKQLGYKPVILVGTLGVSRAAHLMPALARYTDELHLLIPRQPRACNFRQLEQTIPGSYIGTVHRSSVTSIFPGGLSCTLGQPGQTLLATGSIYLMGEIMEALYPSKAAYGARLQG